MLVVQVSSSGSRGESYLPFDSSMVALFKAFTTDTLNDISTWSPVVMAEASWVLVRKRSESRRASLRMKNTIFGDPSSIIQDYMKYIINQGKDIARGRPLDIPRTYTSGP